MADDPARPISLDALLPPDMAEKAESVGVAKSRLPFSQMFALAFLAGAFIALGAVFATTAATGSADLPYGAGRVLTGLVFSLGLILVIVGGAELFTGNNLIVMAWAGRKVSSAALLRNWGIVYAGNFAGSVGTAAVIYLGGHHTFAGGAVGKTALSIAASKCTIGFTEAIALGAMCNVLVCLAVWLSFSARTTADRVLVIVPPITAFVACGFEHCVANMYFIPMGLFIKAAAGSTFWDAIGTDPAAYEALTWQNFVIANLLPVTIGNIIGGAVMVGVVYWFIYLRPRRA